MNTQINSSIRNNTTNNTALAGQASFPVPVIVKKQSITTEFSGHAAASLFFKELLDSEFALSALVALHGVRTLIDLMYLQNAILNDSYIEHFSNESALLNVVESLPSGANWKLFIATTLI